MNAQDDPPTPGRDGDNLWPGELPFTHWGQHPPGTLDLRVFGQSTWWVDIQQTPHRITEMSDLYIANVIGFLRCNKNYYFFAMLRSALITKLGDALLGRDPRPRSVRSDDLAAMLDMTPGEWLEGTSLMRALKARTSKPSN